jgi:uncharacterized protein YjiS (DUF1127 family)
VTSRDMSAVSIGFGDRLTPDRVRTLRIAVIAARWAALAPLARRWAARRRLGRSIAHLDDRLLEDIGLQPTDRGFGQRLIRRFAAGGEIWAAADTKRLDA